MHYDLSFLLHFSPYHFFFFFFNDTATTEIYTLSLHDALPIYLQRVDWNDRRNRQRRDQGASVRLSAATELHGRLVRKKRRVVVRDRSEAISSCARAVER